MHSVFSLVPDYALRAVYDLGFDLFATVRGQAVEHHRPRPALRQKHLIQLERPERLPAFSGF